jgi:hypothetical protein
MDQGKDTWKLWISSFVDAFRRSPDVRFVATPPDPVLNTRLRAMLASLTEALCDEYRIAVPEWCKGVGPLDEPWFVAGMESLKVTALVECPAHFRKRKIFVLGNFMKRI